MTDKQSGPGLLVQPRPLGRPFKVTDLPFADGCIHCGVKVIRLDPGKNWQGQVVVNLQVPPSDSGFGRGTRPAGLLGALIEEQVKRSTFVPPTGASPQRHVIIDVKCIDAPDVPTMDGCQLRLSKAELRNSVGG